MHHLWDVVDTTAVRHRVAISLSPARNLLLADLAGSGLRRWATTRAELIDSHPAAYPQTAQWVAAIHAHSARFDGIRWVSRQDDLSQAVVLVGDRVDQTVLVIPSEVIPVPLAI